MSIMNIVTYKITKPNNTLTQFPFRILFIAHKQIISTKSRQ